MKLLKACVEDSISTSKIRELAAKMPNMSIVKGGAARTIRVGFFSVAFSIMVRLVPERAVHKYFAGVLLLAKQNLEQM